jgi:membrane-bound inhibitor of C-type lysozyme
MKRIYMVLLRVVIIIPVLFCAGCQKEKAPSLALKGGEPVIYLNKARKEITAEYYSLSDNSLEFVKVKLPDGKEYTLPRVLSASGSRYTDEREMVWWIKGDSASVQMRNPKGKWKVMYNCSVKNK